MRNAVARAHQLFDALDLKQRHRLWNFLGEWFELVAECSTCTARERQKHHRGVTDPPHPRVTDPPGRSVTPTRSSLSSSSNQEVRSTALEVLNFLNEKTGHAYRQVEANVGLIEAKLRSGATKSQCKMVIAGKFRQWNSDEKMRKFLRPATLFSARNFEQYLGEFTEFLEGENDGETVEVPNVRSRE